MSEPCHDGNCHGTSNSFSAEESPTKLIVNYIPEIMNQNMMYSLFATMGKLESCKLISNRGYGFVEYSSPEDALKAKKAFNGLLMQNKTIKVSHALLNPGTKPPTKPEADWNLYVCNLPNEMTLHDLHNLFVQFGKIANSRISAGIAFILFDQQYEAERAIQNMNGIIPDGFVQPLTVKYANKSNPNKQRSNLQHTPRVVVCPPKAYSWYNALHGVHEHNIPTSWSVYVYNVAPDVEELTLWQLFGPFGAIISVRIIKDRQTYRSRGYGFITMRNYDQAAMAIQSLNGYILMGQPLSVSFKTQKR